MKSNNYVITGDAIIMIKCTTQLLCVAFAFMAGRTCTAFSLPPVSFIHFIYVSLFFVFSFFCCSLLILIRRRLTFEYQIWSDGDMAQRSRRRKRKRSELDGSWFFLLICLRCTFAADHEQSDLWLLDDSTQHQITYMKPFNISAHHYRRCRHRSRRRRCRSLCDWHDWWIGEWFYESIDLEMICGI